MSNTPAVAATLSAIVPTIVILTESQGAHYAKLSAADQDSFAAKTSAERDAIVAAALAADPEVYKTKAGIVIRKSDGEKVLALAKQADAAAGLLETQSTLLAAQTEATTLATLRARVGAEFAALPATLDIKAAGLRAIEAIADEPTRTGLLAMLKASNALFAEAGTAKGGNPGGDPMPATKASAFTALERGLTAWCQANKISAVWTQGLAAYAATPEGKALADAYNATL